MENTLASELAQVQTMVRELEANMDHQDLPPAAREICGELASRVDRSLRMARSWLPAPESPGSDDGSPRGNNAHFKRRKQGVPSVRKRVRVTSVTDTTALDDGFSWRKYGQKDILGAKYPRAYFRCTHRHTQSCLATKHVQRADDDPLLFDVVHHGAHTCVQATSLLPTGETLHHQAGFEPSFHFASTPPLSPTRQFRSSHAAAGMDLDHQFEEFFSNPPDSFQWDFQDLYATN